MIQYILLKKDLQTIWPDCSSYYLNVSQKAKAKNELLIAIIWIAHCGSTCLLEGFVHSFTLAWTVALNDASLFFFYFYPLAVNNNWLYAVSSKQWKQSNIVETIYMRCNLTFDDSRYPALHFGFHQFQQGKEGDIAFWWNKSWNNNC